MPVSRVAHPSSPTALINGSIGKFGILRFLCGDVPGVLAVGGIEPDPLAFGGDAEAESLASWLVAVAPEVVELFDFGPERAGSGLCYEERAVGRGVEPRQ